MNHPLAHQPVHELGTIAVFDTETTGVDVESDRIVTAFIGIMDQHGAMLEFHSWLVDPGIEIPDGAAAVHGISTERARAEGVEPALAIGEIVSKLRAWKHIPLVAYNIPYDATLLDRELRRHGLGTFDDLDEFLVIDPLVIDKQIDRYRKGKGMRKLTAVADIYGVDLGDAAHDAEADATATGRVAHAICQRLDPSKGHPQTIGELAEAQKLWAADQAANLQVFFRKTNPDAVVDGEWPMRSYRAPSATIIELV